MVDNVITNCDSKGGSAIAYVHPSLSQFPLLNQMTFDLLQVYGSWP